MSDLTPQPQDSQNLLALFHSRKPGEKLPMPFQQEIFLFETQVAGTTHIIGIEELAQHLKENEKLFFLREPNNSYDPQAILIETAEKVKIGYVPKADNVIFSRLMDAGKVLFARIITVKKKSKWVQIPIKIFLEE